MAKVHLPQSVEDWELNYASAAAPRLRGPADLRPGIRAPQARGGLRPSRLARGHPPPLRPRADPGHDHQRRRLAPGAARVGAGVEPAELVRHFEREHGDAIGWDISDDDICAMAKKLAGYADELDDGSIAQGLDLPARVDAVRLLVRSVGIQEDKAITGEPAIKRAQDPTWWRKRLRVHVARVVEGGAIGLGVVHRDSGGYISRGGLERRQQQLQRNAEGLTRRCTAMRSARSTPCATWPRSARPTRRSAAAS